jgi:hemerythrin
MAIITWSESLSVGVRKYDEQHKRLIKLINELHAAMMERKGQAALRKVFDELVAYTKTHFADEEREMKRLAYAGYDKHSVEHGLFVEKVAAMRDKLDKGAVGLAVETMDFLTDWLKKHIAGVDKLYAPHLTNGGVR